MKAWICYIVAGLCGLLGLVVIPDSVREARRIHRLSREGPRLPAEITRIDEVRQSTSEDSEERARLGPYKTVEEATVNYSVAGKPYEARLRLLEPIRRHRLGDKIVVVVLPDEPGRSMASHDVTGNWVMTFMFPGVLLFGAAAFGGAGSLLRDVSRPKRG